MLLQLSGSRRGVPCPTPPALEPTQLGIATQPAGAVDGQPFTTQPVIQIRDVFGAVVTNSTASVTVSKASGSGTLGGTLTRNAVAGVVEFNDLEIVGSGAHTLAFASSGLTGATSGSFTVSSGTLVAVFASDFRTATGQGQSAWSDGGKWDVISGNQGDTYNPNIIANPGNLGFPASMTNIAKILVGTPGDGISLVRKESGITVPTPPFKRYIRFYYRQVGRVIEVNPNNPGESGNGQQHPIQDANGYSGVNWALNTNMEYINGVSTTTTWRPLISGGDERWGPGVGALNCDHTYRFELCIHALTSTTWNLHVGIYNESGTKVIGNADCVETISGSNTLASIPTLTFTGISELAGMNYGNNGIHFITQDTLHSYQGGFVVCNEQTGLEAVTDVIGPHNTNVEGGF